MAHSKAQSPTVTTTPTDLNSAHAIDSKTPAKKKSKKSKKKKKPRVTTEQQGHQTVNSTPIPTATSAPTTVVLKKTAEKFGFQTKLSETNDNVIVVTEVAPGGIAEKSQAIHVGDEVVAINGVTMTASNAFNLYARAIESKKDLQLKIKPTGRSQANFEKSKKSKNIEIAFGMGYIW